jgi:hypothetical protein
MRMWDLGMRRYITRGDCDDSRGWNNLLSSTTFAWVLQRPASETAECQGLVIEQKPGQAILTFDIQRRFKIGLVVHNEYRLKPVNTPPGHRVS